MIKPVAGRRNVCSQELEICNISVKQTGSAWELTWPSSRGCLRIIRHSTKVQCCLVTLCSQARLRHPQPGHCVVDDNTLWQDMPQLNCTKTHYLLFWTSHWQTNLMFTGRNQGLFIPLLAWRVPVCFSWSLTVNSPHPLLCVFSCSIMSFCDGETKNACKIQNGSNNSIAMPCVFFPSLPIWFAFLSVTWTLNNILLELSIVAPNLVSEWEWSHTMGLKAGDIHPGTLFYIYFY